LASFPVNPSFSLIISEQPLKLLALGAIAKPKEKLLNLCNQLLIVETADRLLVNAGDRVRIGQAIAIWITASQAALGTRQKMWLVAGKLPSPRAKQGEIAAQQAGLNRLEAERQGDIISQESYH